VTQKGKTTRAYAETEARETLEGEQHAESRGDAHGGFHVQRGDESADEEQH